MTNTEEACGRRCGMELCDYWTGHGCFCEVMGFLIEDEVEDDG